MVTRIFLGAFIAVLLMRLLALRVSLVESAYRNKGIDGSGGHIAGTEYPAQLGFIS